MLYIRGTIFAVCASISLIAYPAAAQVIDDSLYQSLINHQTFVQAGGQSEESKPVVRARMEWFKQRTNGGLPDGFSDLLMQELTVQRQRYPQLAPGANSGGAPVWSSIGPTKDVHIENFFKLNEVDSGRLRTILPHPTNRSIVYVLSSGGGLWKTTNFTAPKPDWEPKSDGLFNTSSGSAALGKNPDTIYLGLGDPYDFNALVGGFIYKSTDGGNTWSAPIKLGTASFITDIKVDTAGAVDVILVATNAGLFRSSDGGNSYSRVANGPGQAFAGRGIWSLVKTSAGWLAAAERGIFTFNPATAVGSFYLSTDAGTTWAPILNGGSVISGIGRATLEVGMAGDSMVYAFAATAGDIAQKDCYRSSDGGQNWTSLGITKKAPLNPNEEQPTLDLMGGQAWYNQMILVDPSDPARQRVFLGGQLATAISSDGGNTWSILTNWLAQFGLPYVHADFHAAAYAFGRIMFGSDGGLFVSSNGGKTWDSSKNEGLVDFLIYALSSSPKDRNSVIVGLQDDGTRVRQGATGVFNQTIGGDGFGTGWSQANDAVVLGSVYFSFILRHTGNEPNIEKKWSDAFAGIDQDDSYFATPLATPAATADPLGLTFFTYTAHNIYRTSDGAASAWQRIFNSAASVGNPNRVIRAVQHGIGVSPNDLNVIAAAGSGGFLLLTTNGGSTWTQKDLIAGVPGYLGFNACAAWANNSVLYVCSESTTPGSVHVVKSVNGGTSFAAAQSGLPGVPVTKLAVSPRDPSGNTVYAATWIGVYETTNGGASWHLFGAGLPGVVVSDLYMPPDGSFLMVSTYGRGVWRIDLN
jgi:hypothetical protein